MKPIKIEQKLYKVLVQGKSPGTGGALSIEWSLPKNGKPGKWNHTNHAKVCYYGLHVCLYPRDWIDKQRSLSNFPVQGISVYEVEVSGKNGGWLGGKTCYTHVRLVRRIHKKW